MGGVAVYGSNNQLTVHFVARLRVTKFSINPRCGPPVRCGNLRTDDAAVVEATGAAVVTGTRATLLARGTTSTGSSSVRVATTDGSLGTNPDCSRCGVETDLLIDPPLRKLRAAADGIDSAELSANG